MTIKELKEMVSQIPAEYDDNNASCMKCADGYSMTVDINGYFLSTIEDKDVLFFTNLNVLPRK